MLEILKKWFSNKINLTLTVLTVGCIIFIITLLVANNELRNGSVIVSNELAMKDSLHRVLTVENQTLYERYAKQEKDLNDQIAVDHILRSFIKERDRSILSLSNLVQEARLENIVLKGKLAIDSSGVEYAEFDTVNPYYSINAAAWIKPTPLLEIRALGILDSTSVGLIQEGAFIKGFVSHSNPYIMDTGGEFFSKIDLKINGITIFSVPWYVPVGTYVAGVATGFLLK